MFCDTITKMSINKYLSTIESFKGKKIIVTGATSGIGFELVKKLALKDASIILLARNLDKANKVRETLLSINSSISIDIILYDQSDYDLIDSAVKEIMEKHSDFYALVANAAIMCPPKKEKSKQGLPLTIDTNFLGLKRFLDQLIPVYKEKRYIIQGSLIAGFNIKKDVDIYNNDYPLFKQYNISKMCVESLFYYYLVNNKDNEFILTEPGVTGSDIIRYFKEPIKTIGKLFLKVTAHSPSKASLTLLKGLTSDSQDGDFIIPRALFSMRGYPRYKKYPNKRRREFLINKINN